MIKNYKLSFEALTEHIDWNNHVNNLVYLRWAHTISKSHWEAVVPAEWLAKMFWVVGHQSIDYLAETKLGEQIEVETYIEKIDRQKCYRKIIFKNVASNKMVAEAFIIWILLDANSKKPMRIGKEVEQLFL